MKEDIKGGFFEDLIGMPYHLIGVFHTSWVSTLKFIKKIKKKE